MGAGFTGVKGHKPPGFPVTRRSTEKRQPDKTMVNKGKKKQKLVRYVRAVPVCGTSLQRVQQRLVEKHEGNTRSHERIGRTTSHPPSFSSPKASQRQNCTHSFKKMLSQFHAWQLFLSVLKQQQKKRTVAAEGRRRRLRTEGTFRRGPSFCTFKGGESEETVE